MLGSCSVFGDSMFDWSFQAKKKNTANMICLNETVH